MKGGPMKQFGTKKRCRSEEGESGEECLLSDVCSSEKAVGNLSLGRSKRPQRQQNNCCKPPLTLQLQKDGA